MIDVLVIGSGGAGLSSALVANQEGANVLIATKSDLTNSQTVMAQGGINAALGNIENDSIKSHIEDTIKASNSLANIDMVEKMCKEAPSIIKWLESLGVNFSRIESKEDSIKTINQRRLGGASAKRAWLVKTIPD